jgi:hypothetical protein
LQAKLRTLHEVVVRNRLEQLRRRQRDEAYQAQEELLAGVAKSASTGRAAPIAEIGKEEADGGESERYDRSMSPPVFELLQLSAEERAWDVISAKEDLRSLVS